MENTLSFSDLCPHGSAAGGFRKVRTILWHRHQQVTNGQLPAGNDWATARYRGILRPGKFFPGYGFTGVSALALQEAFPAAGKKPAPRLLSAGLALLQDRI
ncbi:hypothetical protein HMPREF1545_01901 [Oscillibacter sp. KLE 1728]|nr:hypothetical protein HMPREF1545_01901 [Oscillibacter sp. KLE 1728]ERK63305.1 hypothetical protein HMPREF1546_02274 [Oscillibacter sp. KLE 1745]